MLNPRQLEQFGLNEKEARVYLAALQLGASSVQNIAQAANIHRVSTYDILESLKDKGYVQESTEGTRRIIIPADPESMMESIRRKERIFADLMPELKALQGKKTGKPRVRYFEGREQVWQAFLDFLSSETATLRIYGSAEQGLASFPTELSSKALKKLSGLPAQIITETGTAGALSGKGDIRMKFVAPGRKFKSNAIIGSHRVISIDWEEMVALVIDDSNNAENQRFIFDMLWDNLP